MKAVAALLASATWLVVGLGAGVSVAAGAEPSAPRFSTTAVTQTGYVGEEFSLVAADFNGDGMPDVAQVLGVCDEGLTVLLGKGDGSFRRPIGSCGGRAGGGEGTAVADVNGDGRPDVIVAYFSASGRIRIWLNDGAGRFHRGPVCWARTYVRGLVAADVNADGIPDLLTQNQAQRNLVVLLGRGGGRCAAAQHYIGDSSRYDSDAGFGAVAVGDVNSDGAADAMLTSYDTRSAVVRLGNGDGTFGPEHAVGHANFGGSVALVDLNHDGKLDAVATRVKGSVLVFLGNGDGSFGPMTRYTMDPGDYLEQVALADLNGDGQTDMAALSIAVGDNLRVRAGRGNGTFGALRTDPTQPFGYDGPVLADFNRDGRPDLAYEVEVEYEAGSQDGVGVSINWSGQPAPPCVPGYLFRRPLPAAKRDIRRAGCRLGAVRRRYSRKIANNRVISQQPRSGTILAPSPGSISRSAAADARSIHAGVSAELPRFDQLLHSMRQCDRGMVRSAGWLVFMLPGRLRPWPFECHAARWVPQRGRA